MPDAGKNPMRSLCEQTAVICSCFLLTSTAYLAWTYHLMDLVPYRATDALTMVTGYALQAAGVGLFAMLVRGSGHKKGNERGNKRDGRTDNDKDHAGKGMADRFFNAVLLLHMVCLVPAATSSSLPLTLLFGGLLNLLCGMIGGYYLYRLAGGIGPDAAGSALALGTGYGLSTVASWILSLLDGGRIYYSNQVLVICLALTAAVFVLVRMSASPAPAVLRGGSLSGDRSSLLYAAVLVLLFSIVNSCGFAFPSADLGKGINLEFARLFYAAGLLIAGFLNEKSRKYGAVCALAALVMPFIMLGLRGEMISLRVFWALSYFTFGFYAVFRMILFVDLARARGCLHLAGFGLLMGRIGDAAGEALCLLLTDRIPLLVGISAFFFVAAVFLFFRVYPAFYLFRQSVPVSLTGTTAPAGALSGRMAYDPAFPGDLRTEVPEEPLEQGTPGQGTTGPEMPGQENGAAAAGRADPGTEDPAGVRGGRESTATFQRFCARYSLSAREREVLRFLLAEKTNTEIADALSITEGTVKYHIHNLLQKTGCRNRIVLLSLYYTGEDGREA